MAYSSQHTLQTMETQTCFNLNAAIANWQQELAGQPDLTPVVRRELETHLRDTITELQKRGLNNEESFWLARRRTGRPRQLGEEFAKADPANVWKDRIFWVVVCLLFVNFWGELVSQFVTLGDMPYRDRLGDILPGWISFYLPGWLRELRTMYLSSLFSSLLNITPVFLLAFFLTHRRRKFVHTALNFIATSRARFVCVTAGAFLFVSLLDASKYGWGISTLLMFRLPWVLSLIGLAAWLIPSKKETTVKPA
jgi:hypothetical protein